VEYSKEGGDTPKNGENHIQDKGFLTFLLLSPVHYLHSYDLLCLETCRHSALKLKIGLFIKIIVV